MVATSLANNPGTCKIARLAPPLRRGPVRTWSGFRPSYLPCNGDVMHLLCTSSSQYLRCSLLLCIYSNTSTCCSLQIPHFLLFCFSIPHIRYLCITDSETSLVAAALVPGTLGPKLAESKLAPRPSLRLPVLCCKTAGGGGTIGQIPTRKKAMCQNDP